MRIPKLPFELYLWTLAYLLLTIMVRWRLEIVWNELWYVIGGFVGLFLFDVFENLIAADKTKPQPGSMFRNVVVYAGIVIIGFFVLTSTASLLGAGLVLVLNLRLIFAQFKDNKRGILTNWWNQQIDRNNNNNGQQVYLIFIVLAFILQTLLFLRV